jgi:alpha-L-rhamnosidase
MKRVSRREAVAKVLAGGVGVALLGVGRGVEALDAATLRRGRPGEVPVTEFGAVGDGRTLNTEHIQAAIDHAAASGGTVVIPAGVFLSGALFLRPRVNLLLSEGGVLKGSTDIAHYPKMRTRIEGHFEENWIPALLNADRTDHLRITGAGTLDGSGAPFWAEFWTRLRADRTTKNLDVERPRLALIQNSEDVQIRGITFKDSGFWNLHLYRCRNVLVEDARFEVPDGVRAPSTDGTDIDSCQHVTIRGCHYRVNDDCIAVKGSKGPFALDDEDSPPVEHIRVEGCTFERGGGVLTCGSEATIVRDVVVRNCRVVGPVPVVRLKLRPDTPQQYEDIHYRDIALDSTGGRILDVQPWRQYFDLEGQAPPKSVVRNVTLSNVRGRFGSCGTLEGTPGQTEISDVTLEDIDVRLEDGTLRVADVRNLRMENVTVNGKPFTRGSAG